MSEHESDQLKIKKYILSTIDVEHLDNFGIVPHRDLIFLRNEGKLDGLGYDVVTNALILEEIIPWRRLVELILPDIRDLGLLNSIYDIRHVN